MAGVMQPLRDEHKELLPHIEQLREAGGAVDRGGAGVAAAVDEAVAFLVHHLVPHATAEERALYPVVGRLLGAPGATATMSRDHVEVGRLLDELRSLRAGIGEGGPDAATAAELRRVLYGLYALVRVHFAKEEEIYVPLLEGALSEAAARAMFAEMERAAAEAKAAAG